MHMSAALMEPLQNFQVTVVGDPDLAAIQKSSDEDSLVDHDLGFGLEIMVFEDWMVQIAKEGTGTADMLLNFLLKGCLLGQMSGEVWEVVNNF